MGSGWLKSLQCKSTALDDVVQGYHSSTCKSTARTLKDIVDTKKPKPNPKPPFKRPVSRKPEIEPPAVITRSSSAESFFPSLAELPEGHPSRNVVEIIFHTSWGKNRFPGRVELVFKVQNLTRTLARFEEYREIVRSGDADDHARCVADGNEVLRFCCLGAASGDGAYEAGCGAWDLYVGKGAGVCTCSESGRAHEKAGGGKGRRAMLVCRVIAGRVRKRDPAVGSRAGYDSVTENDGELLVFDSRALLPCFLIVYIL